MSEKIKFYTSSGWGHCGPVKEFLSQENVDFEEVDVMQDPSAVEELVELTGELAVPVVRKGDNYVIGNDKEKLKQLIS